MRLNAIGTTSIAVALAICVAPHYAGAQPRIVHEHQKLLASDGAPDDLFGYSAAASGDVVVVGASFDDDLAFWAGSAYIFRWDGNAWVEEQKLLASDGAERDEFGISVAASGDVVVVGAHFDGDRGVASGSAYVFRRVGAAWVEEQKLLASDGAAGDEFGLSVAVSGGLIVVGAYADDDRGDRTGSAYVFRWDGVAWVEEQKLLASDAERSDRFGYSVAASGEMIAVGAYFDRVMGIDTGSAYVFRWDGAAWVEEQKLLATDGAGADRFGYSVAASGDVVVAGATFDSGRDFRSGSAYMFRWNGAAWVEERKLLASDGEREDRLGRAVAASGNVVVAGVPENDALGNNSGSAYIFSACPVDCDGSGQLDIFDFLCFQDAFIAGEPYADCDGSGMLSVFDFLCFQDMFSTGCP